jgi:hypothetical protein
MDRPYFTFFKSYFEAVSELEDKNDQLETLMAICSYSLTEEPPEISSKVAKAIFTAIKPTIDSNIKQYKNGAKRKPKASQTEAKRKPTKSQTLTNKDKEKEYINNNKPPTPLKGWFDDPELDAVFNAYVEYRKKNRIPTTEHALELARDKLLKIGADTPTRIAIINQTLERGWRGLFPIDGKQEKKTGFNSFEGQREYDYEQLEKALVANG